MRCVQRCQVRTSLSKALNAFRGNMRTQEQIENAQLPAAVREEMTTLIGKLSTAAQI